MKVKRISLFASGSGTNVQNIIEYFSDNENVIVDSVWSNNPKAFVLNRARSLGVETFVFTKDEFHNDSKVVEELKKRNVDFVVLAGFLWLIPVNLIQSFPIINIHPALLPKYGGKGMYGSKVHQAVIDNHEKESGITIHFVNENYDEGKIIFQAKCGVLSTDCVEDVASKVHQLEYKHYPEIIEKVLFGTM